MKFTSVEKLKTEPDRFVPRTPNKMQYKSRIDFITSEKFAKKGHPHIKRKLNKAGKLKNKIDSTGLAMSKLKKQLFQMFTQLDEIDKDIIQPSQSTHRSYSKREVLERVNTSKGPKLVKFNMSQTQVSGFNRSTSNSIRNHSPTRTERTKDQSKSSRAKFQSNFKPCVTPYVYESDRRAELRNSTLKDFTDFNIKSQDNNSLGVVIDNLRPELQKEINEFYSLFSNMDTLLMTFEDYEAISRKKTRSQLYLDRMRSAEKFKIASIDFRLKEMKIGQPKPKSFSTGHKLKEPPKKFKRFLRNKISAKTKNRLRTFEKFSFTSLEKADKVFKAQVQNLSLNEPQSTLNIVDFWNEEDLHMMLHFSSFANDKKKIRRFNFYQSIELLKKIQKELQQKKLDDKRQEIYKQEFKKWKMEIIKKKKMELEMRNRSSVRHTNKKKLTIFEPSQLELKRSTSNFGDKLFNMSFSEKTIPSPTQQLRDGNTSVKKNYGGKSQLKTLNSQASFNVFESPKNNKSSFKTPHKSIIKPLKLLHLKYSAKSKPRRSVTHKKYMLATDKSKKNEKVFFSSAVKENGTFDWTEGSEKSSTWILKRKEAEKKELISREYLKALKSNRKAPEKHLRKLRLENMRHMSTEVSRFEIVDKGLKKDGIDPILSTKRNTKKNYIFARFGKKPKHRLVKPGTGIGLAGMMRKTLTVYQPQKRNYGS